MPSRHLPTPSPSRREFLRFGLYGFGGVGMSQLMRLRDAQSAVTGQRTAIILKEYHGLTFQEIADLLDCPLSTVKTRLYQGLTVLRKQLREAGVESTFNK